MIIAVVLALVMPSEAWADEPDTTDVMPPTILITALSTGDSLSAADEFVVITNISDTDADVSNWCLDYASANNSSTGNRLVCLTVDADDQIILPAGASASFASTLAVTNHLGLLADATFNGGLSGTGGHVILLDSSNEIVDKIGWGTAGYPLIRPAPAPSTSQILARSTDETGQTLNTGDNSLDFSLITGDFTLPVGNLLEQPFPQPEAPDNDDEAIPAKDTENAPNEPTEAPETVTDEVTPLPSLEITELLPNPAGIDSSNEFIELYNPSEQSIDLSTLKLVYGLAQTSSLALTGVIEPLSYLVIYNSDYHFSLTNTSGQVSLQTSDNQIISITDPYGNAKDGMAWSYIDSTWQWTNLPTPGTDNRPTTVVIPAQIITSVLKPCADDQYRNPATGRCKKIAEEVARLVPCAEGEERNPATNRCRKIASDTATPTPCPEGKERNPDTNRCRNIVSTTPPSADYGVLGASTENDHDSYIWTVVLSVIGAGLVYAVLEWRGEIGRGARKLYTSIYAHFRH